MAWLILGVALAFAAPKTNAALAPMCAMPDNWGAAPFNMRGPEPVNLVFLRDGKIQWNGSPIDEQTLQIYLGIVKRLPRQPITAIDSRGMDCATAERLRTYVEESFPCVPDLCRFAAFENIRLEDYRYAPPPSPPAPPSAGTFRPSK
ncbi:MAG: hypothetical protein ACREB7_15350 [Sphingopyxis sp.]|uniref:hypothetical protein n=1 Tax=Sphingopyxis sp. TaxID=1908224 RepID=UPI003D6D76AA